MNNFKWRPCFSIRKTKLSINIFTDSRIVSDSWFEKQNPWSFKSFLIVLKLPQRKPILFALVLPLHTSVGGFPVLLLFRRKWNYWLISKLCAVKYNYNYEAFLTKVSLLGRNVTIVLSFLVELFLSQLSYTQVAGVFWKRSPN